MKITKTRLKQIIKEELGRILNEEEQRMMSELGELEGNIIFYYKEVA